MENTEIAGLRVTEEALKLLSTLSSEQRKDCIIRGMYESAGQIKIYLDEIQQCQEADRRMEEINRDVAALSEEEQKTRSTRLARQKEASLKEEEVCQ